VQPSRSQSLKFAGTNSLKSVLITVWTGVAAEWLLRRAAGDRGVHDGLRLVSERRAPMSSPPINHADHPANGRMAGRTSVRARCTSVTPRVGYLPRARTQPRRRECMTFAPPLPFSDLTPRKRGISTDNKVCCVAWELIPLRRFDHATEACLLLFLSISVFYFF